MAEAKTMVLLVDKRRDVANGIVSLELVAPDGGELPPFTAGAHIDVHLGPSMIRQYSLCGSPSSRRRYVVGVLLEEEGRGGSSEIHKTVREGRKLRVSYPRNHFPLFDGADKHILVAGGIGVTPLLAMARVLSDQNADFELHYCAKEPKKAAFREEICASDLSNYTTFHFSSDNAEQRFDPKRSLPAAAPTTHLYVCGPKGFMEWIMDSARSVGYGPDSIHSEFFASEVDASGEAFTVVCRKSGITVEVPADMSMAEALIESGVALDISCEQGICGTCLTDVLEGTPDHRDMIQTDAEKATNKQVTPCCSRSCTAVLVLDI